MNKKAKSALIITLVITIITIVTIIYTVLADTECTGQDCSVSTSLTVGNSNPNITWVENISNIVLTGESSKTAYVLFNVTDLNGYSDLNDSTAGCIGYKSGEANRTSSSCAAQSQSGNDLTYNCTVDFWYFDTAAANWAWNCSVSDNSWANVTNDTVIFTIAALNYVDINATTVTWSNANPNQADQEASAPINLDNGGNQDYATANVTAYNATNGGSNIIPATNFSLDADTGQTTGQTYMAENLSIAITSWFTLPHGNGTSEDLYTYVDMPNVPTGSYSSTSNWLIEISA